MAEQEDVEFIATHGYIANSSTDGTILTDHLLNISGKLWTPKKKKKKKRNQKRDQQPWWEAEGERRSPHSEKLPHGGRISCDRKARFGDQRRMQQTVCGRQDKVRTACRVYTTALHIPESRVTCCKRGLGAGKWGLQCGPREGTAVGCEKTA